MPQQMPELARHEYMVLDTEDDLKSVTETETEAFDDDPFENVPDIDCSVSEYLLCARLTCLPCMSSSLEREEDLPRCGSCKDLKLGCCRIRDTQDREQRRESESDTRLSRTETSNITETPSPTLTRRNPENRVDRLVVENAEESSEVDLAAPSIFSQDSNLPENIDQCLQYSQHFTILQSSRRLHSLLPESPRYAPPTTEQTPPSNTDMAVSTRKQSRNDLKVLGQVERHPIEVGSAGSDNESENSENFVQSHGSTDHPITSHSPTLPSSTSTIDLQLTSHFSEASRIASVSSERILLGNAALFLTNNPACKRRCIHDVFGDEDSVKVPRLSGRKSVVQATTHEPVPQNFSSDGNDRSENKTTPTVPDMSVPVIQRSSSRASPHLASSDVSGLPISSAQRRQLATSLHARGQPDSSEDSDPPINPSQKRRLARRPAKLDRQPDSSEDSDPPINPSQKRRLARHRPAKPGSQPDSSEDCDPPINPSQKQSLARHRPAKSKGRPGSFEDSDQSLTFAIRRPPTRSQYARLNDADTPSPSTMRFNPERNQTSRDVEGDASDASAPLVPSWNKIHEGFTPSSPAPHLDDDNIKSLLRTSGTEDIWHSRIGLEFVEPVLGQPSTNTYRNPIEGSRSPKNLTVQDERPYPIPVMPQTGKLIDPIQVVRPAEPVSSQTAVDKVTVEVVEQELRSPKPRKSRSKKAQQYPILGNRATKSSKGRPTFGIKDIVPEAVSSKRGSFTLKDVVPSKTPREQIPPQWGSELKEFHDALRMSFAPVVVAPDWILNAPLKKRKFTLADVTGTEPQEPLFSIEYALEQYLARQNYHKQPFSNQISDRRQGAEGAITWEQTVISADEDIGAFGSIDSNGERPFHYNQHIVEPTANKAAEPHWTEIVGDAEDYLAGDEDVASTKNVKVTSS